MRVNRATLMSLLGLIFAAQAIAGVPAQEAERLKNTLNPLGGERAGNKEGTIPAWDGGTPSISGAKAEGYSDPFGVEKPLFSITAKNVEQYSDKLSEGAKAMLKKYPNSFRIDAYPTHRTAIAPQWVYENTYRNATRAKTLDGGLRIEGAYGGIPFPIPQSAHEVIWNHLLRWDGTSYYSKIRSFMVQRDGKRNIGSGGDQFILNPYYLREGSPEAFASKGFYYMNMALVKEPPSSVDENALIKDHIDQLSLGTQAWIYLSGQRRTRKAPEVAYDTPTAASSGVQHYDEVYIFRGAMDRYEWKIVGKREMYVPYNVNKFFLQNVDTSLGVNHLNPDAVRWELHRVWLIEGSLAPGKRNVIAKRRLYIDEDSWNALLGEGYDAQGQLWKVNFNLCPAEPAMPGIGVRGHGVYNVLTGDWFVSTFSAIRYEAPRPESYFTPANLGNLSQR